jgi:hypothetical protein
MDPEKKLRQIQEQIRPWGPTMDLVADQVLDQDISRYPIFVVHPATVELGIPIVEKSETARWAIHISTLEEFATRQLIKPEHLDAFRSVYKDPTTYHCLFILSDLGAQFVFMPRVEISL